MAGWIEHLTLATGVFHRVLHERNDLWSYGRQNELRLKSIPQRTT